MYNPTNGSVGLDVDARSIRLAAVRVDELLEERTPPYDKQAVERLLRRWPRVRCCYEAGPTDFGSTGTCSSVVSTVQWWRRGWAATAG